MKHFTLPPGLELKTWSTGLLVALLALMSRSPAQADVLPQLLTFQSTLTNCPNSCQNFCESVAIDGDTIVFGGRGLNAGLVYVREGPSWANPNWQLQGVLTTHDGGAAAFGQVVALSGDVAAVGAPLADGGLGAVYIYQRTGSSWAFQARVVASDGSGTFHFGASLALSGNTLIAGAPGGVAAYVFVGQGSTWAQQQKLTGSDPALNRSFGGAVAIEGDTAVVGSSGMNPDTGLSAAYVFVRNGTNWTEQQKLLSNVPSDLFGESVAVSSNTVVVGAPYRASMSPAVYVFARAAGVWSQRQKLTLSGEMSGSQALAISGRLLAAASWQQLYVFGWDGAEWGQPKQFTDPIPSWGAFNVLGLSGDTIVAGFGGVAGSYGNCGGPVATYAPNYADDSGLATAVRGLLYFPDAVGLDANFAAFRYKQLLYGMDSSGLRAQVESITNFYGAAERARAAEAEADVWHGLSLNTNSVGLGQLLLDIYYDRVVAESLVVRDQLANADTARFGPPLAPPAPTGGFLIDNEIPRYRQALDTTRSLWQAYVGLFTNAVVVQTPGGGGAPDATFGTRFFRDLVPGRGLDAATYLTNGVSVPVVTNTTLFSGYKDLVLVFNMLRDYARFTENLGRLLTARNDPGDRDEAGHLIGDGRRFLFLQGSLLQNMFTNLPPAGDSSALAETIAGWSAGLNRLDAMEPVLTGDQNPLGFAPDFLMLVEKFQGSTTTVYNSFDSLMQRLDVAQATSPLRQAHDRLAEARAAYGQYRGYQDQLAAQMTDSANAIKDRLFQIVGARPGDLNYSDNPTNNPGSELDQQYLSADAARLQLQKDQVEMNNLNQQVQIELDLMAATNAVTVEYGNLKAGWQQGIDIMNCVQGVFNDMSDWASITLAKDPGVSINPGKILGSFVKWGLFFGTNYGGGQQLAQLAADEQAQILGLQTAAHTKTVLLGLDTLRVDAQSAAVTLQQELNRLAALYREKADLEARLAENGQNLASRYFADPVHRLAAESAQVRANLAFDEAQKWLFFAARAFEYKWNIAFTNWVELGHTWSLASLFALRNADELEDFCNAMADYDAIINRAPDDAYDWFSVRDDFMGFNPLNDQGHPASYQDPVSGQALDAISMFRTNLYRSLQPVQGGQQIVLQFDTVRQIPGGTFFVGPTFGLDGSLISPGRYLDKIGWVLIQLLGPTNRAQLAGTLTYGGSSFIRNMHPGQLAPGRPDQLVNEMTSYSTRYWFFDPIAQQWNSTEGMTLSGVPMQVMPDPTIPPSVNQIEELKERSVAATGWILRIPIIDQGKSVLSIEQLNDVRLYIYHYSVSRH